MPVLRAHPRAPRSTVVRLLVASGLAAAPLLLGAAPANAAGTRADVDSYLDEVADRISKPGIYVDPAVLDDDLLSSDQVTTLTRQATKAPGPLRIMVLPVDRLTVDDGGRTPADLAYRPRQLVREIYERVDRKGTYAVLVAAPSQVEGQSLFATQWPRGGTAYDIRDATDQALRCCAPDYAPMLRRFVREADDRLAGGAAKGGTTGGAGFPAGPDEGESVGSTADGPGGWAFAAILALAAGMLGLGAWSHFRRGGRSPQGLDDESAQALRTALTEEVDELRQRVDSLGPSVTGDAGSADARAASMRRLLDQAAGRLSDLRTSADAQSVARTLADARYEYAAAAALRDGRPAPTRTPPCFIDPRHGLSVATVVYAPAELTSPVPVCGTCRTELEAGQDPRPRLLHVHGDWVEHWRAGAPAWVYLHGYWAGQPFMHEHFSMPPSEWAAAPASAPAPEPPAAPAAPAEPTESPSR